MLLDFTKDFNKSDKGVIAWIRAIPAMMDAISKVLKNPFLLFIEFVCSE